MRLVVGLGNPGRKYSKTKHNIGFMCLDKFAQDNLVKFKKENKFRGESLKEGNLVLLKPHTFMNLSGESIRLVTDYYNIDVTDVLIIYDDLALPLGKLRLREKGSPGGHNGIKSIMQFLNTNEFMRFRVGIGRPVPGQETADYVLEKFTKTELEIINDILEEFKDYFVK